MLYDKAINFSFVPSTHITNLVLCFLEGYIKKWNTGTTSIPRLTFLSLQKRGPAQLSSLLANNHEQDKIELAKKIYRVIAKSDDLPLKMIYQVIEPVTQ